ncbi:MAG TPA: diacylglycerol kinase family protein [Thermoleophilaceae bacterium]|nr:diacylglycerol kinase family protein [Thermoleophilaceae bacterium]
MSIRLALLANPAAAGGRAMQVLAQARPVLESGAEVRAVETRGLDHALDEAAAAAAAGETVVAVGGDGTVGALAGALRDAPVPLAILPGGRGNDFARVLGIPFDAVEAAEVVLAGRERVVDVAEVDGRPFVGIASLGFDSDANRIANETKIVRGNLVYVVAALRALAAWKHASYTVTVDGERHEWRGFSVAVGNSKAYGGGMMLIPHAEVDDGLLDVFLSGESSKLGFLRDLPKVFKGDHVGNPSVRFLAGREVTVDADRPFTVYADGDPIGELPVTVTVRERCLRVVVPGA